MCMWIGGVAMCPFRDLGIVCNLGLGGWLAKICFSGGFPCIRHIGFSVFVLFACLTSLLACQKWFDNVW
jgi:hypothetical protein